LSEIDKPDQKEVAVNQLARLLCEQDGNHPERLVSVSTERGTGYLRGYTYAPYDFQTSTAADVYAPLARWLLDVYERELRPKIIGKE
jgi:hypothetical protein